MLFVEELPFGSRGGGIMYAYIIRRRIFYANFSQTLFFYHTRLLSSGEMYQYHCIANLLPFHWAFLMVAKIGRYPSFFLGPQPTTLKTCILKCCVNATSRTENVPRGGASEALGPWITQPLHEKYLTLWWCIATIWNSERIDQTIASIDGTFSKEFTKEYVLYLFTKFVNIIM